MDLSFIRKAMSYICNIYRHFTVGFRQWMRFLYGKKNKRYPFYALSFMSKFYATKLIKSWSPTTINHATLWKASAKTFGYYIIYVTLLSYMVQYHQGKTHPLWLKSCYQLYWSYHKHIVQKHHFFKNVFILMLVKQLLLCWYYVSNYWMLQNVFCFN